MMVMLSACEISKENNNSNTQTQADTLPEVVTYNDAKGDDLSGGLCEDGAEGYRVWYADNGDIYAFDAVDNFYLKKADSVYYGVYEFYSYNSAEQYGFLQFMCDNSKDINERFSVVKEGEDFVLTSQSDSSKKIRISKTNSNTAEDLSGKSIYEIMGFNLYYITKDSFDDSELEMVVNACPASYEKAKDGASPPPAPYFCCAQPSLSGLNLPWTNRLSFHWNYAICLRDSAARVSEPQRIM